VRLAISSRTLDELPYRDELAAQTILTTREAHGERVAGRIAAADVMPLVDATPDADMFVCGSAGFAEAASRLLVDLGVEPSVVRVERFGPTG
jgi:ferredoxin-NADP reductase